MENFNQSKSSEVKEEQINHFENFFNASIPLDLRKELLTMNLSDIKSRFPDVYQKYFAFLKEEAYILHFPGIEVKDGEPKPTINALPTYGRGYAYKINFSDMPHHVIKPFESVSEKKIADKASELGIGPKQFETKDGFIHEEFIEGMLLLKIEADKSTPEFMEEIGKKLAQNLKKLHENDILVNDQLITNDYGKSHTIIDKTGEVRFIDFGAAIDIKDFPNISDDAIWSLIRTEPMFNMFRDVNSVNEEQKKAEIINYREHILPQLKTKEHLIHTKDMQFLEEGLQLIGMRNIPNVSFFIKGVRGEMDK